MSWVPGVLPSTKHQAGAKIMIAANRRVPLCTTLLLLSVPLFLVTTSGCSSDQKKTYPVKGKFVWPDGSSAKELAGGMVIFQCDEEQVSSKAPIDQEGGFVLGTYKLTDGTVAGKHKVAIVQPAADFGDHPPLEVVHRRYESLDTSDLKVTVEPKPNDLVFKVMPGAWLKRSKR
jgi:hypothetical protein